MRYLLDTGILIRLPHRSDAFHPIIRQALVRLGGSGHTFVTGTQNMAEFWNVCTRPSSARGGLGLDIGLVRKRLRMLERFIVVLHESDAVYSTWKSLVVVQKVHGKQVHDARLAALMTVHRIRHILTLNAVDFVRYPGVEPIAPQQA
jgi:predicted nucleic acid-binding protein